MWKIEFAAHSNMVVKLVVTFMVVLIILLVRLFALISVS